MVMKKSGLSRADRTVLPIVPPDPPEFFGKDACTAVPPERFEVTAPEGAPNIVLVLLDDMGFGACDTFGGPIPMRTANRIAANGLRYNCFHTTALCAPTRACILTGYNHHTNNMGSIPELGTAFPGNTSVRPKSVTPLARILRDNGYATAQFGKCHEIPTWEITPNGPFTHWPTYSGFDKFYGFINCESNQYHPELYDGTTKLPIPDAEGYHLTEDLTDKAIEWIKTQKAFFPEKPFFLYFAPGATHTPHQAPKEYIDHFKGAFDDGWDAMREKTLKRMIEQGIVPPDTKLAPKPSDIADWDTLDDRHKELYAREMEVYAGFAEHTDDNVGRLYDCLEEMNLVEDTLFLYILGDNGASAEGQDQGLFNAQTQVNHVREDFDFLYTNMDKLGTEEAFNHYATGWAIACDAPFSWAKQVASDFGGTRNGLVIQYPKMIPAGGLRTQFHHSIDIAPTILEIAGIPHPDVVDGVKQRPLEGVSMVYSFNDEEAPSKRKTQYFCNRANYGVYHKGWFAGVIGKLPWAGPKYQTYDEGVWDLYHVENDFSLSENLAERYPEKLAEMKEVFEEEALKYHVFPIDNRGHQLFNSQYAGRPDLADQIHEITLCAGMERMRETCFPSMKNTSYTITADFRVEEGKTDGVLVCQGGRFGGWSLYIHNGYPTFLYNFFGQKLDFIRAKKPLVSGTNQVKAEFIYDGGGQGAGGLLKLYVNGIEEDKGRIGRTVPLTISSDETASAGVDLGTPVSPEYTCGTSRFSGDIYQIHISTYHDKSE